MLVNYFGPRPVSTTNQSDAFANGQAGMAAAERQVAQASNEIAQEPLQQPREDVVARGTLGVATDETGLQVSDMTRQLIQLHEGELAFRANARSIEAAHSMFDNLLATGRNSANAPTQEVGR